MLTLIRNKVHCSAIQYPFVLRLTLHVTQYMAVTTILFITQGKLGRDFSAVIKYAEQILDSIYSCRSVIT